MPLPGDFNNLDNNQMKLSKRVAAEVLKDFTTDLVFTKHIYKASTEEWQVGSTMSKAGLTYYVKKPNRFKVHDGVDYVGGQIVEEEIAITCDRNKHVDLDVSEVTIDADWESLDKQFFSPAASDLADQVDLDCIMSMYPRVFNRVGIPGSYPTSTEIPLEAKGTLFDYGVPNEQKTMLISSKTMVTLGPNLMGIFHTPVNVDTIMKSGEIGIEPITGFTWYASQNIAVHNTGNFGDTEVSVVGDATEGTDTITLTGFTNFVGSEPTLAKGDGLVFSDGTSLNSIFGLNPKTHQQLMYIQKFTVIDPGTWNSGTSEIENIKISPRLVTNDATDPKYESKGTVTKLPLDGQNVRFLGDQNTPYEINFGYSSSAFCFAAPILLKPDGIPFAATMNAEGFNISVLKDFNIQNLRNKCRIDTFYGINEMNPFFAVLMYGGTQSADIGYLPQMRTAPIPKEVNIVDENNKVRKLSEDQAPRKVEKKPISAKTPKRKDKE